MMKEFLSVDLLLTIQNFFQFVKQRKDENIFHVPVGLEKENVFSFELYRCWNILFWSFDNNTIKCQYKRL